MMRITGGEARGATIKVYRSGQVRPTSDKVRQAIFNILEHRYALCLDELSALDLFAGSGSLGLEFLSRGGRAVTFVELDKRAAKVLRDNLNTLDRAYAVGPARVVVGSVDRTLRSPPESPFDVVFADPPYRDERGPALLTALTDAWVSAEGVVIIEHAKQDQFDPPEGWVIDDRRRYGDTLVSFVTRSDLCALSSLNESSSSLSVSKVNSES